MPIPPLAIQTAADELKAGNPMQLDAWVSYRGELVLYNSEETMKHHLVFPYCISAGLGSGASDLDEADLDGKKVRVSGTLLRYRRTPDAQGTISTWALIDGMHFQNWCLGPYVLKVETVTVL